MTPTKMTKDEAIRNFVEREFNSIPQDWVRIVAEAKGEEIYSLPMWGTMWFCDRFGKDLYENHSRVMVGSHEEIDLDAIEDEKERADVKEAIRALNAEEISWGECALLEKYIDEEMAGQRCIINKNGGSTAVYIYEIDGEYLIGVNGAGWNFYDGVWDMLYDVLGLQWHTEE